MDNQLSQQTDHSQEEILKALAETKAIIVEQSRSLAYWRDRLDRVQILMRRKSSVKWDPAKTRKMTSRRSTAQNEISRCEQILALAEQNLNKLK